MISIFFLLNNVRFTFISFFLRNNTKCIKWFWSVLRASTGYWLAMLCGSYVTNPWLYSISLQPTFQLYHSKFANHWRIRARFIALLAASIFYFLLPLYSLFCSHIMWYWPLSDTLLFLSFTPSIRANGSKVTRAICFLYYL